MTHRERVLPPPKYADTFPGGKDSYLSSIFLDPLNSSFCLAIKRCSINICGTFVPSYHNACSHSWANKTESTFWIQIRLLSFVLLSFLPRYCFSYLFGCLLANKQSVIQQTFIGKWLNSKHWKSLLEIPRTFLVYTEPVGQRCYTGYMEHRLTHVTSGGKKGLL